MTAQPTYTPWFKLVLRVGRAPLPVYWPTRAGGTVKRDSEPVQETTELLPGASSSSMFALKSDLTTGTRGREEARGGRTSGEGAEGGADGKKGQMSHGAVNLG